MGVGQTCAVSPARRGIAIGCATRLVTTIGINALIVGHGQNYHTIFSAAKISFLMSAVVTSILL